MGENTPQVGLPGKIGKLLSSTGEKAAVQISRTVAERMAGLSRELAGLLDEAVEQRLGAELAEARDRTRPTHRRELADMLNQAERRLRGITQESEWGTALLAAAGELCQRAALLGIEGGALTLLDVRGGASLPDSWSPVPLHQAPALAMVRDSQETAVVLRAARELSTEVMALFPDSDAARGYAFPVLQRDQVVALLYAEGGERAVEVSALELLAAVAGARRPATAPLPKPALGLIGITGGTPRATGDAGGRARWMAQVEVAALVWEHPELVRQGRAGRNLYRVLGREIETRREAYRQRLMSGHGGSADGFGVDHFHEELVRFLARHDPSLLGPDYPGPLV